MHRTQVDVTNPNSTLLTFANIQAAAAIVDDSARRMLAGAANATAAAANASTDDARAAAAAQAGLGSVRALNWTRVWGRHGAANTGKKQNKRFRRIRCCDMRFLSQPRADVHGECSGSK